MAVETQSTGDTQSAGQESSPIVVQGGPGTERIEYPLSFQETVEQISDIVVDAVRGQWDSIAQINEFRDCVYLKNPEGVLVYVNHAYVEFFSPPNQSPLGRSGEKFLEPAIIDVSKHTDEIIVGGSNSLDCEHKGRGQDGRLYAIRTHKRNLTFLGNPGLAILGISRLEQVLKDGQPDSRYNLAEQFRVFQSLGEVDREIARLIAMGVTAREVAKQLELTPRTVELRKKKILDGFQFDQTIKLVKLLVRLEDRGFLDLGL